MPFFNTLLNQLLPYFLYNIPLSFPIYTCYFLTVSFPLFISVMIFPSPSSCSCHSLLCPPHHHVLSFAPVYASFPATFLTLIALSQPLPLPPPHLTTLFVMNACFGHLPFLCIKLFFFSCCCFVLILTLFDLNLLPSVTLPCGWLSISFLSSAHGGLPPTPAAGVPCPPPAWLWHRGQAHQAAGQLLRGGDPKDGRLSLWGGH